jgi:hypothetical protein
MTNPTQKSVELAKGQTRLNTSSDLIQLVLDAARSCWSRFVQRQKISGLEPNVEITVEYEDRSIGGWEGILDVAGLRR